MLYNNNNDNNDSNNETISNNFWLMRQNTYGNALFMKKFVFKLSFIIILISMILWYVLWIISDLGFIVSFYDALIVLSVNILIFIACYHTRKFIDNFYI